MNASVVYHHQGHPRLVNAISTLYSRLIERPIDPKTEVLVTVGAYEALYCALMGHVNPGDEVIIVEPFFDCYEPMTLLAGGIPVFIPLRQRGQGNSSKDYILDPVELESKFSNRTKMIVINTPHNPLGKVSVMLSCEHDYHGEFQQVFSREELEMIGNLCKKYNTIAVMDEVYEWIVYNGSQHIRMGIVLLH